MEIPLSDNYFRRQCLIDKHKCPTQTEVRQQLGGFLAEVFFQTNDPVCQKLLGTSDPLEGPKGELWVSPSDQLIGKVMLKPPMTTKYIKALTHMGIMEIGGDIEKRRLEEAARVLNEAVNENEELMRYLAARQLEDAILELQKKNDFRFRQLEEFYENKLKTALSELEDKLLSDMNHALEEEKEKNAAADPTAQFMEVIRALEKQNEINLQQQASELQSEFEKQMQEMLCTAERNLIISTQYRTESLKAQKHALECAHVADLICAICSERGKAGDSANKIRELYELELDKLKEKLAQKIERANTCVEPTIVLKPNTHYERRIRCIIEQFQKFVNFALKAIPSQAEFLLSIEKLLMIQMSETLLEVPPQTEGSKELAVVEGQEGQAPPFKMATADEFVKKIHEESDEPKPFILFDDCQNDPAIQSYLKAKLMGYGDLPYVILGGHNYANIKNWNRVCHEYEKQVKWDNEEPVKTKRKKCKKPEVPYRDPNADNMNMRDVCGLLEHDDSDTNISSSVRFSVLENIHTLPEQPHASVEEVITNITAADELFYHEAGGDAGYYVDMEDAEEGDVIRDQTQYGQDIPQDITQETMEQEVGAQSTDGHGRRSKLLDTKDSLSTIRDRIHSAQGNALSIERVPSIENIPKYDETGRKSLVKHVDSLLTTHSSVLLQKVKARSESQNKEKKAKSTVDGFLDIFQEAPEKTSRKSIVSHVDSIEVVLKQKSTIEVTKMMENIHYKLPVFSQEKKSIRLDPGHPQMILPPYMIPEQSICDKLKGKIEDEYEPTSEFQWKMLLNQFEVKEKVKPAKPEPTPETHTIWDPYDTSRANKEREIYKQVNKKRPCRRRNVKKIEEKEDTVFDRTSVLYSKIFGGPKHSSETDVELLRTKERLKRLKNEVVVEEEKVEMIEPDLCSCFSNLTSNYTLKQLFSDLGMGSYTHLQGDINKVLNTPEFSKRRLRSITKIMRKYPSFAKLLREKNEENEKKTSI